MKNLSLLAYSFFLLTLLVSCAHKEKIIQPTPGTNEAAGATPKADGAYYTIVEFEKGTSKLTEKSKKELKEFLTKTEEEGAESKEIKILTFPDVEKAKKKDAVLADKRAMAIMNYLKKKLKAQEDLLPFNMTNRASVLNAFLESDDPKAKKVFEKTGKITSEGEDLAALKEDQTQKALIIRDYE